MLSTKTHISRKGRNKTAYRRTRKYKGGMLTLKRLPVDESINSVRKLHNKWEFMILSGHGMLLEFGFATVPKDTFILFNSPTGCKSVYKKGIPYDDLLMNDDYSDFLMKMLKEIREPKSLMKTFDATSATGEAECFGESPAGTSAKNFFITSCPDLTEAQKSRAIYTPGTKINDMMIHFQNNPVFHPLILGLYDLPLKTDFVNHAIEVFPRSDMKSIPSYDKVIFGPESPNKIPDIIGRYEKLSDILSKLPVILHGKKRFLFITSCRGLSLPSHKEESNIRKRMRQYSIGLRENVPENSLVKKASRNAYMKLHDKETLVKTGLYNETTGTVKLTIPNRLDARLFPSERLDNVIKAQAAIARARGLKTDEDYRPLGLSGPTLPPEHPNYKLGKVFRKPN